MKKGEIQMDKLVMKLKQIKNATQSQYDSTVDKYAKDEVLRELKEAGISKDDLSDDEYEELLKEKTKQAKTFANGALTASGAILFLELLG